MDTIIKGISYFLGFGSNPITVDSKDDVQAIRSDWENVGRDIQNAMTAYGKSE